MTAPVDALMARPVGRPVALQVSVAPDWVSAPTGLRVVIAVPETFDLAVMAVTDTVLLMVQAKDVEPAKLEPSVATTVTEETPGVDGVPVMVPVEELIDSPAGRPVALQVSVAPDWESVAALVRLVMAEPVRLVWLDLAVTDTVLVIVQEKVADPAEELPSVAVMVTVETPGVVGVPVMAPPEAAIESPAGRPVAVQVRV